MDSRTTRTGVGAKSRTVAAKLRSLTHSTRAGATTFPAVVPSGVGGEARRTGEFPARTARGPGWFLAFEGADGAGKSTQLAAIARWLRDRGFDVVATREPGATDLGVELRDLLLRVRSAEPVGPRAEALLFAADRAEHVDRIVRPALERGAIVLTDRHVDSSIAYQSGGRELPEPLVAALSEFAVDGVRPDLTILLDLDHTAAAERMRTRSGGAGDRMEGESPAFHARVRETFRARAATAPERYLIVDATEPASVITAIIQDRLATLLPPSARELAEAEAAREAQRLAHEAERRKQEALHAEERAKAQRAAEQRAAELEAERLARERQRAEAARAAEQRAAEERARAEREAAQQALQVEADRRAAKLRAAQERARAQADAEHRAAAEIAVREAEAAAKERAKRQAAEDLAAKAEFEARTTRLLDQARRDAADAADPTVVLPVIAEVDATDRAPSAPPNAPATAPPGERTAVLPVVPRRGSMPGSAPSGERSGESRRPRTQPHDELDDEFDDYGDDEADASVTARLRDRLRRGRSRS